jgi:hypothetical protein
MVMRYEYCYVDFNAERKIWEAHDGLKVIGEDEDWMVLFNSLGHLGYKLIFKEEEELYIFMVEVA